MFRHDNGVHVYTEGGHKVQSAEDHVGQLDGDPLRFARAVDPLALPGAAYSVADAGKLAILRREGARPINERAPSWYSRRAAESSAWIRQSASGRTVGLSHHP